MTSVLRAAKWWIQDYVYAVRWQLRASTMRVRPEVFADGTLGPVVVVPGIYENWRFLLPLIRALHDAGHPIHVVTALQHNRRPVIEAASLVAKYIERTDLHRVIIVAHSKGGLIGKYAMLRVDRDSRIAGMVAICTPFSGSRYARFLVLPSLRAFSPRDALTLQLAREESINPRITSVFGRFDPHIPDGSVLPGALNIEVDTGGHFRILSDPTTIRTVLDETARLGAGS